MIAKRITALLIDFIVLAILGYIIALIGKDLFVELGTHGVLVGWLISTTYFTIFNSNLGNGQSIGKRAMDLEVVNNKGDKLTLIDGLVRSLLFTTPFFLFDYFQSLFGSPIVSSILGALNIAYYVGLLYFFLVNSDRRTVHDLIARTNVKLRHNEMFEAAPLSKLKLYIYAGIIVTILGGFIATYFKFRETTNALTEVIEANMEVLTELAAEIYELEQVVRIESSKIHVTVESEIGIVIEAWVNEDVNKDEANTIYENIMDILTTKKFNLNRIDYSEVVLKYGYDIGIADYNTSRSWKTENSK